MGRNADMLVKVVGENPDATVTIVGDQVIEATPADVGKVVTVDGDGNLVLASGTAGGIQSVTGTTPIVVDNTDPDNPVVEAHADLIDLVARWVAASAAAAASLAFAEDTDNGSSVVTLAAPAALAADRAVTLPDIAGTLALLSQVVRPTDGGMETVHAHGNTGATETIDLANGNVHTAAQDQACTYTFTNPTNGVACSFTLILTAVTGAATWPASVNWPSGVAPTLTGRCILTFVTVDGGTNWDGFLAGSGLA